MHEKKLEFSSVFEFKKAYDRSKNEPETTKIVKLKKTSLRYSKHYSHVLPIITNKISI